MHRNFNDSVCTIHAFTRLGLILWDFCCEFYSKAAAYNQHFLRFYFSALDEYDQNAQITIFPTLQWADLFFVVALFIPVCVWELYTQPPAQPAKS